MLAMLTVHRGEYHQKGRSKAVFMQPCSVLF
nr:MAG TPA: hypothetical protein [Caudoviricetes sp.]